MTLEEQALYLEAADELYRRGLIGPSRAASPSKVPAPPSATPPRSVQASPGAWANLLRNLS